jgi:hypothetical protein
VGTMLSSQLRVRFTGYLCRLSNREFLLPLHSVTSLVLLSPPHNLAKYSTLGTIFWARLEEYVEGVGHDHPHRQGGLDLFGLAPPPQHYPLSPSMLLKYSLSERKLSRERDSIERSVATSLWLLPRLAVPLNRAPNLHLQHQIGRLTIGVPPNPQSFCHLHFGGRICVACNKEACSLLSLIVILVHTPFFLKT